VSHSIVSTNSAPAAIGPYSQGVKAKGFVFLSGQIPLDPTTMELVAGDIEAQTRQVLENLKAVIAASGCTLSAVTKTTIFLTDLSDFAVVNRVYAEYFTAPFPARSTVGVAALPRGARVEIEAIAFVE
jgi:2-iminobutanoate/2-iminopropanoate deaminase